MTTKHHITHAEKLYWGDAKFAPYAAVAGRRGVQIVPTLWQFIGAPITNDPNGLAESQTVTGAGTAFDLDGTLVAGGVGVFDVPRAVVGGWTNSAVVTVTGYDVYGKLMVESSASGTSFVGKKAFQSIFSATTSATITGATLGHGKVLGLPFRITNTDEIVTWESGVIDGTGTIVAAVAATATATTGDVRGTWAPADTVNGTLRFAAMFCNLDPSSKESLFGVAQFAG